MTAVAPETWTILKILRWTTDYFLEKGVSEARASAEVLLAHVLGVSRLELYLRYDQPLTADELSRFKALILRRRVGEPVAYLTGHKEFWSLDFQVAPGVLIPRPETEILVTTAIESVRNDIVGAGFKPAPTATGHQKQPQLWGIEIGVGSGAVVVALAKELPQLNWLAVDLSPAALAVARENARRHGVSERLRLVRGDLVAALQPKTRFALMVANLPYVPRTEWEQLPKDIKDFEPTQALLGGEDGLDLILVLTRQAHLYLQPGGAIALEVGAGQAQRVLEMLSKTGAYEHLETVKDYLGIQRVVRGKRGSV
ncbi:MAG: peptide chain release factor N(5)-glutamine methyltransferase [Deltaproteobacteria bacterium]|nr:peptide chain release factor N(5)-glutamine methyltransferase [Deltaproteobacteria bacterium]